MSKPIRPPMDSRRSTPARKVKTPAAPPAYRPQPVPKVLQRKAAPTPQKHVVKTKPAPRVLQAKAATGLRQSEAKSVGKTAPPVYRPQPLPRVLQRKTAAVHQP